MVSPSYTGRFAPSPTGPLHAGSLVAALASWLDARAHGGRWLLRLEDVDTPRTVPGADQTILHQLAALGLQADEPPLYQSQRGALYAHALDQLRGSGRSYACTCSRKDIEQVLAPRGLPVQRHSELVYPGTCRPAGPDGGIKPASDRAQGSAAWRLVTTIENKSTSFPSLICKQYDTKVVVNLDHNTCKYYNFCWHDRRLGPQSQQVEAEVGDFVLQRADGCFTYQLAVVVDDAAQGITDVVRGQDLADNTARQILLQQALGLPTPRYLHTPLVLAADGQKLSKQNGATTLDLQAPLRTLCSAAQVLGLTPVSTGTTTVGDALAGWVLQWRALYNLPLSASVGAPFQSLP